MKKSEKTSNKTTKRIRWIARIWSIPVIAYALVMIIGYTVSWITTGVADPHAVENYPFIENLPPMFMFLAIVGLGIAWFKEKLGGIINLFFCLVTIPILIIHWPIIQNPNNIAPYILTIIVAFPGILFLVYWHRSKKIEI
jgi:phosphate starvation-inducible membrane PsiE